MKRNKTFIKKENAFTLIELLAIIIVLSVIMAIAIPQVINVVKGSKGSAWESNVAMITKAINLESEAFVTASDGESYTLDELCSMPSLVNKLSKSEDITVTCRNNNFFLEGKGEFEGRYAEVNCSNDDCVSTIYKEPLSAPASFATDSWDTIIRAVRNGDTSVYAPTATGKDNQVLRKVDLGELGTHYLRVANTTPCTNGETSETACGFVIEFADIISLKQMHTTNTNKGGYPATDVFTYLSSTVYNALPSEIRNSIINTVVISGHGLNDSCVNCNGRDAYSNFVSSKQKLYLLDSKEVFRVANSDLNTSASTTRQLDYYRINNNMATSKQFNGLNTDWLLRSVSANDSSVFKTVSCLDECIESFTFAKLQKGVSPAFRIG